MVVAIGQKKKRHQRQRLGFLFNVLLSCKCKIVSVHFLSVHYFSVVFDRRILLEFILKIDVYLELEKFETSILTCKWPVASVHFENSIKSACATNTMPIS